VGSWQENLDHAVRSLGHVSLHISPRRFRVRLRPDGLSWGAYQQLISILLDDDKPVVLDIEGVGPTELYDKVDDAIARIDDLRAMNIRATGTRWRPSFISDPLSLERLKTAPSIGLRAAHRGWVRCRGMLNRAALRRLLDAPLSAPMLLARIDGDGRPSAETWPRYIALYAESQLPAVIGRPFDEHPLHTYSALAAHGYRETARDEAPRLELIEAVVRPGEHAPIRMRYERLLLPWRAEDGTRYVSGLSRQIWRRATACPVC
jgi:hypothetical protein